MQASIGDQLRVFGHHVGDPNREGEIVEVHGGRGEPPYVVRWSDGHTSTFVPSADTRVEHVAKAGKTKR
jgi:hypothetical protein